MEDIKLKIGTNGQFNLRTQGKTYKATWNIKSRVKDFIKKNPEKIYTSTGLAEYFNCGYVATGIALRKLCKEGLLCRYSYSYGYIYVKKDSEISTAFASHFSKIQELEYELKYFKDIMDLIIKKYLFKE